MMRSVLLFLCLLFFADLHAPAQMPLNPAPVPPAPATAQARTEPEWLASAVIYEIFPRTFSPEGNLNGITRALPRLQSLGVNVLWLMPIHPVGQAKKIGPYGSPYAVQDYYAINPAYGTKEDMHRLVEEAHRMHMRVIIDVVANHTAFDSVMMAHPDFYKHDAQGNALSPNGWTDVAALDYANPKLRRYMTDMLLYWVNDFKLDGFRCDAAAEVPTSFWEQARTELERAHPGILMLAEASKPELLRSAFDLDYSWPMLATLNNIFEHGAPASALRETLEHEVAVFPRNAHHMRVFDDHDEQRALARYGIPGSLAAATLVFTLDGVPMLYNGMEVGDPTESGAPALFEDLKVWWQAGQMRPEFPIFYNFMLPLRQQHAALRQGTTVWLHNSDEAHLVSFVRHDAAEDVLVVVNLANSPFRGTVEAAGRWDEVPIPMAKRRGSTNEADPPPVAPPPAALPALSLAAFEYRIFKRAAAASSSGQVPLASAASLSR